jgi:hypothetical protein
MTWIFIVIGMLLIIGIIFVAYIRNKKNSEIQEKKIIYCDSFRPCDIGKCVNKRCVVESCTLSTQCKINEICDNGSCKKCEPGYRKQNNKCVKNVSCPNISCGENEECIITEEEGGICYPCKNNEKVVNGKCTKNTCENIKCEGEKICVDVDGYGKCVPCQNHEYYEDGECRKITCNMDPKICEDDVFDKYCNEKTGLCELCPPDTEIINGKCVVRKCEDFCEDGVCVNNICNRDLTCKRDDDCPFGYCNQGKCRKCIPGQHWNGNKCVAYEKICEYKEGFKTNCLNNQICQNDKCMDCGEGYKVVNNKCVEKKCDEDFYCTLDQGQCIDGMCIPCDYNEKWVDGKCISKTCDDYKYDPYTQYCDPLTQKIITCKENEVSDGNKCVNCTDENIKNGLCNKSKPSWSTFLRLKNLKEIDGGSDKDELRFYTFIDENNKLYNKTLNYVQEYWDEFNPNYLDDKGIYLFKFMYEDDEFPVKEFEVNYTCSTKGHENICTKDEKCINGICQEKICGVDFTCNEDQICQGNKCYTCPESEIKQNNMCVKKNCITDPVNSSCDKYEEICNRETGLCEKCPSNSIVINGKCVQKQCRLPSQDSKSNNYLCNSNEFCIDGECVYANCSSNEVVYDNKICRKPCESYNDCKNNEICYRSTIEGDLPYCKICGTGEIRKNNECVPEKQIPQCREGEYISCVKNVCRCEQENQDIDDIF